MSKALRTYERGKFRYTVRHTATNGLYVRKAVIENGRQRQIWRICEPQTQERVNEILSDIEAEVLTVGNKSEIELARIFLQVRAREIEFNEFVSKVKIIA